jgi:hypothetical protein
MRRKKPAQEKLRELLDAAVKESISAAHGGHVIISHALAAAAMAYARALEILGDSNRKQIDAAFTILNTTASYALRMMEAWEGKPLETHRTRSIFMSWLRGDPVQDTCVRWNITAQGYYVQLRRAWNAISQEIWRAKNELKATADTMRSLWQEAKRQGKRTGR